MLTRHVIGYFPSFAIPALASFIGVYCFTHLLLPAEYGHYTLAVNSMTLLNAIFFYWMQLSLPRFMPQAIKEGKRDELYATIYIAFTVIGVVFVLMGAGLISCFSFGDLRIVAYFAVPLTLGRAFINMNEAVHRSELNYRRYNLLECSQAVLGLVFGLVLICGYDSTGTGAIVGLLIGMAFTALIDVGSLLRISLRHFNRDMLKEILRFGTPLVVAFGFSTIISISDRFFIEYYYGPGQVGIYSAGYSIMDRISQIIFMMVIMPSYPLTIHKLEHEGVEAARMQTYRNGVALLLLALPACAGLMLAHRQIAAVMIGSDFRAGAAEVMPWIALSGLLNGFSTHYFDHAFHLSKKPYLLLFTQGPAAMLNIILNFILIPRYGYMGAAYATAYSYALLIVLSICIGRRAFSIRFPFVPALKILCSVAAMSAVLCSIRFPEDLYGLISIVTLGTAVYGMGIALFDVAELRTHALIWLRSRLR